MVCLMMERVMSNARLTDKAIKEMGEAFALRQEDVEILKQAGCLSLLMQELGMICDRF